MASTSLHYMRNQRGATTLIVAILLLGILSVITLFAANVGLFEVKTGANAYRADRSFQVSQQGLSLGLEYIKQNRGLVAANEAGGWLASGTPNWWWRRCAGAVASQFPCSAEPDATRRAGMYAFVGARSWAAAQKGRLPLPQPSQLPTATPAVDPNLRYEVGALLCAFDPGTAGNPCLEIDNEGTVTTLDAAGVPKTGTIQSYAVKIVSRGAVMQDGSAITSMPDAVDAAGNALAESRATLSETYSSYHLIGAGPEAPLIAANDIKLRGTIDIVANGNAGGFGIPMSIWSTTDVDPNGTPTTCHMGEFLSTGSPTLMQGVQVCQDCTCPRGPGVALTYKDNSCPGAGNICKGNDIIDATGNGLVTGQKNFPSDLFQYMLLYPRSRWADKKARSTVLDGTCTGDPINAGCCADLNSTSAGFYWSTEADCTLTGQIGTVKDPVFLLFENNLSIKGSLFFGVLYAFDETPPSLNNSLTLTGQNTIYGALVSDSNVDNGAGTAAIVYSSDIMNNLLNGSHNTRVGPLAGSWNDLQSF